MDFSGKAVFVTGAAQGIGRVTACAFAQAGADVAIADIDQVGLSETAEMVSRAGVEVEAIALDVTSSAQVAASVDRAFSRFGRIDCAHNNAGFYPMPGELPDYPEAQARKCMEINYWGIFYCMQAQIRLMLEHGGGTIVNTASGAGLIGFPASAAYCGSKHAVVGLTRSAAIDYAARGVRINAVCPGVVETTMVDPLIGTAEGRKAIEQMHPIDRLGTPQEIADVVLWLSSDRSTFVVGAAIAVDGGFTAK